MAVMKSGEGVFGKAIKSSSVGGQNSNTVGSDNTNLILKGKAIKVQWGNRFIDLIKDGKINVENQEILKTVSNAESISENGIYLIPETQDIWVSIDSQKINISGGSYLSFMVEQELDQDEKFRVLSNAGFYYKSLADARNITSGVIYVEDENKLYIYKDGSWQDYLLQTEKQKDELIIGDIKIYKNTIDSSSLILSINGVPYISLGSSVQVNKDMTINGILQSKDATSTSGFRLYDLNGISTLEIDNIINRSDYENNAIIYSAHSNTIIEETIINDATYFKLLKTNQFKVGDIIYALVKYTNVLTVNKEDKTITVSTISPVSSQVDVELIVNDTTHTLSINAGESSNTLTVEEEIETLDYKILKGPDNVSLTDSNNRNLFKYQITAISENSILFEGNLDYTNCKIYGQPLIKIQDGNLEVINEDSIRVKIGLIDSKVGVYSDNISGTATDLKFSENYPKYEELTIPETTSSEEYNQVIPNVEWIKKLISSYLPIGTIIMYSGSAAIPEDWTICDGSHGSPNLIGKFIKASDTIGETIVHENNEITLTADNLPQHSHSYTIGDQTSTGSISNTTSTGTIGNTTSTGSISNTTSTGSISNTKSTGSINSVTTTGNISSTKSTGSINSVITTGTIGNTTSTGTFNGTYEESKSSTYSSTSMGYSEIINIPKDDKGDISDSTIKNWGVSTISYDVGGINYSGYISMDPHTHSLTMNSHNHELTMDEHSHSLTMNEHGHTLTMDEHGHILTINEHGHTLTMDEHSHSLTMDEHGHILTMNSHSHSISEQSQEWKNIPIKIEPNYYSLIFIMKWK